jgi:cytochrome c-type biogenesis protein CcmH/NrfG
VTDARNMLGVIYARQGKKAEASAQWSALLREAPDYRPARTNWRSSKANRSTVTLGVSHARLRSRFAEP